MPNEYQESGKSAVISDDGVYRYLLTRTWKSEKPTLGVIGLNPSTADAILDDPTIRREVGFAKNLGYGSLWKANLFAYRTPSPTILFERYKRSGPAAVIGAGPDGKENWRWLEHLFNKPELVIGAWGAAGDRCPEIVAGILNLADRLGRNIYCLGVTKTGQPKHPLYLPKNTKHRLWVPPECVTEYAHATQYRPTYPRTSFIRGKLLIGT